MAVVQTLIGNVKGPQGETGATGATGAKGDAATITVGSVSTTAYGNAARVENVGTENDAILNFTIPQGAPGQRTTTMSGLTLDTVTTSAEEFPVPAVGENGATVWGKVIKFFRDTIAALTSKLDANKVVNSQAVTEAGYALDAQQANPNISGSLANQVSSLNDSLNNVSNTLIFPNTLIRNIDLNDYKASGVYYCAGGLTNRPGGNNYGALIVYGNGLDFVRQIFYPVSEGQNVYTRAYYNAAWSSWYRITGTS